MITVQGVVASVPKPVFHGVQFICHTSRINHSSIDTLFLLTWHTSQHAISIGDKGLWQVRLKPPIGLHNPGGFDYARFLFSKNITATGTVIRGKLFSQKTIAKRRQQISEDIHHAVADPTLAAFVSALCVGLREGLTTQDWRIFQKTGTNHLVAIAGLHIGFVASAFYFVGMFVWRRAAILMLLLPAKTAAEIFSLLGALIYTSLSGFAIPAARASIMLACFLLGNIFARSLSLWRRLMIAAVIILMLWPMSILDASFWLSFMSIAMIGWIIEGRLKKTAHWAMAFKMQIAIMIGLLPWMFLFFYQASVIGLLANAIAIPWVGFLILPLTLLGCLFDFFYFHVVAFHFFKWAGIVLKPLWFFLTKIADVPYASIHHVVFTPWILWSSIVGVIFLLAPRYFPFKTVGVVCLLPLFFYHPPTPALGDFWVSVIDVGQGLSVLVQTRHHVLLYDTGARYPSGFDLGAQVVTPYLWYRDVHHIDVLEISHGDNDHSGGVDAILHYFDVDKRYSSAPVIVSKMKGAFCHAGQNWQWDGVFFQTLSPAANVAYEDNNSSCVLKIENAKRSILLAGDIEASTEAWLVAQYGHALRSTVLVAPHHGSKTSSSELFLSTVQPKIVLISSGKYNHYHLPSPEVLERYHEHGYEVMNTAEQGMIFIK